MNDIEIAVEIDDILKITGWSRSQFYKFLPELRAAGVVFLQRKTVKCKDGKRRMIKKTKAFPSRIQTWISIKASKGEIL